MVSLISAVVVTTVGAVPFLGLIVPNIVSLLFGDNLRRAVPWTALFGAGFVLVCDIIGRTIRFPYEVPVGMVMSVLGAVHLPGPAAENQEAAMPKALPPHRLLPPAESAPRAAASATLRALSAKRMSPRVLIIVLAVVALALHRRVHDHRPAREHRLRADRAAASAWAP